MMHEFSNSVRLSRILQLPATSEPVLNEMVARSRNGIYIGPSKLYGIPVFIDFDFMINPHIFITGITGAGKTYLTKNLMLKLCCVIDATVILVDFTGEYREFVDSVAAKKVCSDPQISLEDAKLAYIDLKGLKEEEKIARAVEVLNKIAAEMRTRDPSARQKRVFVILDEAWKLVRSSGSFETIIREGRKYSVGIVLASQLLEDVGAAFLSNIASLFVFRIQNDKSIDLLAQNYGLTGSQAESVKHLEVGSCLLIQLLKTGVQILSIRRVSGIKVSRFAKIMFGDGMGIEIEMEELSKMAKGMCEGKAVDGLLLNARECGYIRLEEMIKEMILCGADRRMLLGALRKHGIADYDIADAFAAALSEIGEMHEGKKERVISD